MKELKPYTDSLVLMITLKTEMILMVKRLRLVISKRSLKHEKVEPNLEDRLMKRLRNQMERDSKFSLTTLSSKVTILKARFMVLDVEFHQKVNCMKANSFLTKWMEMVFINGQMDESTTVHLRKERNKEKDA